MSGAQGAGSRRLEGTVRTRVGLAMVAGSNLESGRAWGASGGVALSDVYYDEQFVFRSGVTAVPGDSATYSELAMAWVFGKEEGMKPWLIGILMCSVFLRGVAWHVEGEAGKNEKPPHVWWAPDSSWAVGGFGKLRPGLLEEILAKKPPELDGLKGYELAAKEPGEWLGFGVALKRVEKVVFTKNTKIVLVDKGGRRIESEAIVFYPDLLQTSVYDCRKMAVVVTKSSVWCNPKNGYPSGNVKFPAGSIELKNIAGFEVVGAVEDRGGG